MQSYAFCYLYHVRFGGINNLKKSGLSGCLILLFFSFLFLSFCFFFFFLFLLTFICFKLFLFFPVVFFQFYVFSLFVLFQCFIFLFVKLCFVFSSYFCCNCNGKEWFKLSYTWTITNDKNHQQHPNVTKMHNNLKQLLILKKTQKKMINDGSNIHSFIIANILMNETNGGIKYTNVKRIRNMNFMNVLKMIFYNCNCIVNWTKWYYFEILSVLSSIFCHILSFDLTQQMVYQKWCVKMRTKYKKMQEKCKDNENNQNNRSCIPDLVSDDALHISSYVLIFSSINTLLNMSNIFLNKVEYDESDIIKIVDCANVFAIIVNGYVVVKLNLTVTPMMNNIIDELQLLLIQILALVKLAHTLYSLQYCETTFWLILSFISTLLQDCPKQSFVSTNKATFNIFHSIHMSLRMIEITVQPNDKMFCFILLIQCFASFATFILCSGVFCYWCHYLHCNNMQRWDQRKQQSFEKSGAFCVVCSVCYV